MTSICSLSRVYWGTTKTQFPWHHHKGFPQSPVATVARTAITGRALGQTRNDPSPWTAILTLGGQSVVGRSRGFVCQCFLLLLEPPCRLMALNWEHPSSLLPAGVWHPSKGNAPECRSFHYRKAEGERCPGLSAVEPDCPCAHSSGATLRGTPSRLWHLSASLYFSVEVA